MKTTAPEGAVFWLPAFSGRLAGNDERKRGCQCYKHGFCRLASQLGVRLHRDARLILEMLPELGLLLRPEIAHLLASRRQALLVFSATAGARS